MVRFGWSYASKKAIALSCAREREREGGEKGKGGETGERDRKVLELAICKKGNNSKKNWKQNKRFSVVLYASLRSG